MFLTVVVVKNALHFNLAVVCLCVCVCMLVMNMSPAKTEIAFGGKTCVGQGNHVLDEGTYGRHLANRAERSLLGVDVGCWCATITVATIVTVTDVVVFEKLSRPFVTAVTNNNVILLWRNEVYSSNRHIFSVIA